METIRQRILLGGVVTAGVGLAVLIGVANPPSPRELVLAAAQAAGLLSEKGLSPHPAKGLSPSTGQSSDAFEGGQGLPGEKAVQKSASETETNVGPSSGGRRSSQADQPLPRAGCSNGSSAQAASLENPRSSAEPSQRKPPSGEVLAIPAPAYGQQASGSPSGATNGAQTGGSGSSQTLQQPPAANAPFSQSQEEVPKQLLELWKLLHSGRQPADSSAASPSAKTSFQPTPEAPPMANPSSASGGIPSEDSAQSGGGLTSSGADNSPKVFSRAVPLSGPGQQTAPETSSTSAHGNQAGLGTAQVQREGDGRLIINIRNEDIRKVLEMLSEQGNLNILAASSVQGKVSATLAGVDLESALQAILRSAGYVAKREGQFIYVGAPEDFLRMEQAADRIGTRVYRPNYVKAADLKDLIQPLLTEKVGLVSVSAPAEIGIASDDDKAGGNNFAGHEAILVRDYENVLTQIDQVVAEIDVRPMQVHIQAMILSVRLDDTDKFGVDFRKLINNSNFTVGWGTPVDSLSNITFTQGGLKFGFVDGDVGVFLEALESVADASVIAAPRLMVLNKHRADILIGRQEGYVNTTQTETATTQSVQFLDIGTQLRIRPFISPDGLIRMEIHPELSDGAVTVQGNFTLPQKDVTKVTTNIMVRDGCTVVIGGLMQEQATASVNQIPFFGNLPVVGVLFRRTTEELRRVEIIVLVTPHIVWEPEAYAEGALKQCEFQRRQDVYLEKMSPLGKRSVARRYLRMAQEAWAGQDMERALRFAEMAVHFDPLNRDALEFRAQVWQSVSAGPLPEEAIRASKDRSWTAPLDGPTVAPWIFQEMEKSPSSSPGPERPLPEVPPPPESGGENPDRSARPRHPLPPAATSKPSESSVDRDSANPSRPSFGLNPVREEGPQRKEIRRPSLFQTAPFRTP